jgi:hypothetical protein
MKRTPGRPPLDEDDPSVPLSISIPAKQLRACEDSAKHDRLTVQEWIRRVLRHASESNKKV